MHLPYVRVCVNACMHMHAWIVDDRSTQLASCPEPWACMQCNAFGARRDLQIP